jgi:Helix-turn-helix domain
MALKASTDHPKASEKFDFLWRLMADKKLSAPAKCAAAVLLLQFHNTRTGQCNPSYASIAKGMGRDRSNAVEAVRDLIQRHWLRVESTLGGSKKNTNQFDFNFERESFTAPASDPSPGANSPQGDVTPEVKNPSTQGDFTTRTTKEPLSPSARECGYAPDGAFPHQRAPDGALEFYFQKLCTIWRKKPDGVNEKESRKAFLAEVEKGAAPEAILASAEKWAAATPERFLKKLERWLADGAWQNEPRKKHTQPADGRKGKQSLADIGLDYGEVVP